MSEIEKYYNGEIHVDFEEIPIELYRKTNNEFVKYVRYDDYKKLENIIKEVREYIDKFIKANYEDVFNQEQKEYMVKILQMLDKESELC